MTQAELENEHI